MLALALAVAALCCLLAACSENPLDGEARDHLIIGVGRDFYDGPDSRAFLHGSTNTWEALTYLDHNLEPAPWLALAWHTPDAGRTWVFKLRQGVRFHDNTLMTAGQVARCIRRIAASPKYDPTGSYRHLLRVEAREPDQVTVFLSRPTPNFPSLVAYYGSPVVKPELVDDQGRILKLIATGPFRVAEVRPGRLIRLERFDGYWGPRPAYARVTFQFLFDAQTRLMALMAGDIDVVADVGAILPLQVAEVQTASSLCLKKVEVATTHYMVFNCRRPPFDTRQARGWAVKTLASAGLVKAVAGAIYAPAVGPYSRLARQWVWGLLRPLAEAGPPPGPAAEPVVILLHGGTVQRWPYLDLAQALQHELKKHRIPAAIEVAEAGAYYQALREGRFGLTVQPNTLMTGDPDFFYSYYLASAAPANPGWHDAEADELIRAARVEMDQAKRRAMYRRLEAIMAQGAPLWPLFHEQALYAHRDRVAEFSMDHSFRPDLIQARPASKP